MPILTLENPTDQNITIDYGNAYFPSDGKTQSYVTSPNQVVTVPAFSKVTVEIQGYCTDIFLPPASNETNLSDPIFSNANATLPLPSAADSWRPTKLGGENNIVATIPGSTEVLGHTFDIHSRPDIAAVYFTNALKVGTEALAEMRASEEIPEQFAQITDEDFTQQFLWQYGAILSGKEYKVKHLEENFITQYETNNNKDFGDLPKETQQGIKSEIKGLFSTIELIGVNAKLTQKTDTKNESWGPIVERKYQEYAAYREMGHDHDRALRNAVPNAEMRRQWGEAFRKRYEGK